MQGLFVYVGGLAIFALFRINGSAPRHCYYSNAIVNTICCVFIFLTIFCILFCIFQHSHEFLKNFADKPTTLNRLFYFAPLRKIHSIILFYASTSTYEKSSALIFLQEIPHAFAFHSIKA